MSSCASGWVFGMCMCVCELASVQGLSLGACSTPAEQCSGTVSGYLALPHPDSCGTVIFDHTPKPNENSHLGESFIRVHTRSMLSDTTTSCPFAEKQRVLSDIYLFLDGGVGMTQTTRREPSGCDFFHHPRRRSHLGQPPRSPR